MLFADKRKKSMSRDRRRWVSAEEQEVSEEAEEEKYADWAQRQLQSSQDSLGPGMGASMLQAQDSQFIALAAVSNVAGGPSLAGYADTEEDELSEDEDGRDLSVENLTDFDLARDRRSLTARLSQDIVLSGRFWSLCAYHWAVYSLAKRAVTGWYHPSARRALKAAFAARALRGGAAGSELAALIDSVFDEQSVCVAANSLMSLLHSSVSALCSLYYWRSLRRSISQAADPCQYRYTPGELLVLDHSIAYTLADTVYVLKREPHNLPMLVHHFFVTFCLGSTRLGCVDFFAKCLFFGCI